MSSKAIFILFLFVTGLSLAHTRPIPGKIYLDQAPEDPNKEIMIIEFDKEVDAKEIIQSNGDKICPWGPPALCRGGTIGKIKILCRIVNCNMSKHELASLSHCSNLGMISSTLVQNQKNTPYTQ